MATSQPPDPTLQSYTDPTATLLNTSCLDFLLIELVPLAYRITADLAAREEEWLRGSTSTSTTTGQERISGGGGGDDSSVAGTAGGRGDGTAGGSATVDEEEAREAVFHRLESLGYRVGLGVVERYVHSLLQPCSSIVLNAHASRACPL